MKRTKQWVSGLLVVGMSLVAGYTSHAETSLDYNLTVQDVSSEVGIEVTRVPDESSFDASNNLMISRISPEGLAFDTYEIKNIGNVPVDVAQNLEKSSNDFQFKKGELTDTDDGFMNYKVTVRGLDRYYGLDLVGISSDLAPGMSEKLNAILDLHKLSPGDYSFRSVFTANERVSN